MARRGQVLFRLLPIDLTSHAQPRVVPGHLDRLLVHDQAQPGWRQHLDVPPLTQQPARQGAGLRDLDPHPRLEGGISRFILPDLCQGDGAGP